MNQPFLDPDSFPFIRALEENYPAILEEYRIARRTIPFIDWHETHLHNGTWRCLPFYTDRNVRVDVFHQLLPRTSALIEAIPGRKMAGFSVLGPGTQIFPHEGYITQANDVRLHLPIVVPSVGCSITVAGETRAWQAGKALVFNDHLLHSAQNLSGEERAILLIDFDASTTD